MTCSRFIRNITSATTPWQSHSVSCLKSHGRDCVVLYVHSCVSMSQKTFFNHMKCSGICKSFLCKSFLSIMFAGPKIYKNIFLIFIFERERERERTRMSRGGSEREGNIESELSAQSLTWGSNSRAMRS